MQAAPFEFWPRVGIFAAFPPVDLFRYRWLHVLYPFYFAIIACGIGFIFKNRPGNKLLRRISLSLLIIVVLAGAMNTYKMCSFNDKKRLSYYKGYNYDQFAPKFILTDFDDISVDKAVEIAKKYPEENRGAAYQCLGTRLTRELLRCTFKKEDLLGCFENMPSCNQYDFMYGIIRALLDQPNYFKIDFVRELAEKYPLMFYENIGYSYLAYKYYGCMINKNVLFDNIAPNERRYFKTFLDEFEVKAELNIQKERLKELVEEIIFIPEVYQKTTIFGLGKLIGAEMLFDPLHMPDYPLDSKVGFMFSEERQTAFFEGVGAGFAETLCRFCRALMPSEGVLPSVYEQMIDIEWQRCLSLMKKMPPSVYMNIKQGFALAMKRRDVNQTINKHINRSYKEMQDYEINAQNKVF